MKTVIIGSNHAGIAAANTLLDNYPGTEVVLIDRNTNLSYLGCGTALWVGRQIDGYEDLFYTNEATFREKGAKIFMESSVTSIDFNEKIVHFENKSGEAMPTSLASYYDPEFTQHMDKNLEANGIELHFGELATEYKGDKRVEQLVTDKGTYDVDMVINAIGFTANSDLGKDHLETFRNGAYLVDNHQKTSDDSVYAVGDCATIYSNALEATTYIALATNAVRSGIIAGHNVGGTELDAIGVQGSNGISIFGYNMVSTVSIFGYNMVSTGLSVAAAKKAEIDVDYTDYEDLQKPGFIKENAPVRIRIVYEKSSRRIVGAQLASTEDISANIHMFSLAVQEHVTIDKLKLLDIFFLPHFNQPYNYITMAALRAK